MTAFSDSYRIATACIIALCLLGVLGLSLLAHTDGFHLTELIALRGFSAIEYMEHVLHPGHFTRDFPGGVSVTGVSVITLLYAPLASLTGLSGVTLVTLMMGLEMAFVMVGAWVLWSALTRRMYGGKSPGKHQGRLWIYVWLCTILLIGKVTFVDLASFKFPFFHGQFYGFADGLRLAAIGFALNRRWGWAALCLCAALTIHPIKACFGALFVLALAAADWRQTLTPRTVALGVASAVFAVLWAGFIFMYAADPSVPPILPEAFIGYTRIFQYHWYPLDNGMFSTRHDVGISPFLALMTMTLLAVLQSPLAPHIRRQLLAGYGWSMLLSMAGIAISVWSDSIRLIMLCMMRASELMVLIAPFLLLLALWSHYRARQWQWVAIYAVFLLGGLVIPWFMPPLFAALAALLYLYEQRAQRLLFTDAPTDYLLTALAVLTALVGVYLGVEYPGRIHPFLCATVSVVAAAIALPVLRRIGPSTHYGTPKLLLITVGIGVLGSAATLFGHQLPKDYMTHARNYLQVQLWANEHTKPDALFMVDPCINYGWRDFSSRSSLGTPREWYMTGWVYRPDGRVLDRGERIGKTLGLDMTPYLVARDQPVPKDTVCQQAQALFYDPSGQALGRLTRAFGVDYYVMLKDKAERLRKNIKAVPLVESDYYVVYNARDVTP